MKLGTSSLVVAAFVGPGTVLTCATTGVRFGYGLGWVLIFATAAALVLQSFTAAVGILARQGLGQAMRETLTGRVPRLLGFTLVVLGLWIGCAAFEMGNLLGAASGIAVLMGGEVDMRIWVVVLGCAAALLLLLNLRVLVRVFTVLVAGMSALFLLTLFLAPVDWGAALRGLAVPQVPEGSLLTLLALIGTTIVTYNLFLHAAVARAYWADVPDGPRAWRRELAGMALFIPLGGLISFAILATGATLSDTAAEGGITGLAAVLEPVAGPAARYLFGVGLFAAGLTSALTAPLAAAAGIRELFGWPDDETDRRYRAVWGSVVGTGLVFGLTGWPTLPAIVAAQAANGMLLPFMAGFMLYLVGRQTAFSMPAWYRALGIGITLVCAMLGARTLWWVWTQII